MEIYAMYLRTSTHAKEEIYRKLETQKIHIYKQITQDKNIKILVYSDRCSSKIPYYERKGIEKMLFDIKGKNIKKIYILEPLIISHDYHYIAKFLNEMNGKYKAEISFLNKGYIGAYIRVSTQKQSQEGVSIEMQKEKIYEQAKRYGFINDYNDIKWYIDRGMSAKSLERDAMITLIEDIKNKKIDFLFAYDLARLSREISDSQYLLTILNEYKVQFELLTEVVKYATAADRCATHMKMVFNQYEREKDVERTNDGLMQLVREGKYPCGGPVLFGYRRNENGFLEVVEEEAIIVRKMFDMAKKKESLESIMLYLNSIQDKRFFKLDTIINMLHNVRYAGVFPYKNEVYYHIIPKIVNEELIVKGSYCEQNSHIKNQKYHYENLVYCSCEYIKMKNICGTSKSQKVYYYYQCPKCNRKISQKKIDDYMYELELVLEGKRNEITKKRSIINRLNQRKKEINMMLLLDTEIVKVEELAQLLSEVNERIKKLKAEIEQIKKLTLKRKPFEKAMFDNEMYEIAHVVLSQIVIDENKNIQKIIERE